jgi:DNA-binding CsgD family transcriptional regulator
MSRTKKYEHDVAPGNGCLIRPELFVFFDKKTGIRRFEVEANQDGSMPVDHAVNLLAIHCVARQRMPSDFDILIGVGKDLIGSVVGRASSLMRTCSVGKIGAPLSTRQREVLTGIVRNQSNKEIASLLNISVRTIKFHVSVLLAKFHVHSRVELMLQATNFLSSPDAIRKRGSRPKLLSVSQNGVDEASAVRNVSGRAPEVSPADPSKQWSPLMCGPSLR